MVSDEIHYINDVERGTVWEETLMHLPSTVQMVALSATLREPETFLSWISKARGRPGKLVRRKDRHVPLHVGALDRKSGAFVELFGTHGPRAGIFDRVKFTQVFSTLTGGPQPVESAVAAAAAAHRRDRDKEKEAQLAAFAGRRGAGRGRAPGGGSGRGVGRGTQQQRHTEPPSFASECVRLAKALHRTSKLPAIVFCMSRRRCVEGALALGHLSLFSRHAGPAGDGDGGNDEAAERRRQTAARAALRARDAMHREHLQRFMPELGQLDAYQEVMHLLNCGVAYHHSGMLPVLREFVELCFQQKLVRVVFATETLAVGVNMPARTVVFSQLDKPNDANLPGHRPLRPDEFWQMAGRAGRRGMDDKGFVVYAPTLSVAGLRNMASAQEMASMLTGDMPAATSRLTVDRSFVLRHLNRGSGPEVLGKTLRADLQHRQEAVLRSRLAKETEGTVGSSAALIAAAERCADIEARLGGQGTGGIKMSMSQKQRSELQQELAGITAEHGAPLQRLRESVATRERLRNEMAAMQNALEEEWTEAVRWLDEYGFLLPVAATDQPGVRQLTPRGRACAAFADGHPLIIGTIIADGTPRTHSRRPGARTHGPSSSACSQAGCVAFQWARFAPGSASSSRTRVCRTSTSRTSSRRPCLPPCARCSMRPTTSPACSRCVRNRAPVAAACSSRSIRGQVELDHNLSLLMLDWVTHKDIKRIAYWMDASLIGSFVKAVMRVVSYVDVVREVLLGLGEYETHNALDGHMDALLGGLVTNESLYLRIGYG